MYRPVLGFRRLKKHGEQKPRAVAGALQCTGAEEGSRRVGRRAIRAKALLDSGRQDSRLRVRGHKPGRRWREFDAQ